MLFGLQVRAALVQEGRPDVRGIQALPVRRLPSTDVGLQTSQGGPLDQDPRGYDPLWDKYSVIDTGTNGMNKNAAYNGPPVKSFKTAGKMPPFAERLLPFWKWPSYTIEGEVTSVRAA